jgi:hypothetical protein
MVIASHCTEPLQWIPIARNKKNKIKEGCRGNHLGSRGEKFFPPSDNEISSNCYQDAPACFYFLEPVTTSAVHSPPPETRMTMRSENGLWVANSRA